MLTGTLTGGTPDKPRIVYDGAGGAIVAWTGSRNGSTKDVFAQRFNSSNNRTWGDLGVAACLASGDQDFTDQTYGAICSDGAGGCYITWEDPRAGGNNVDIYVQRLTQFGAVATGWPANGLGVCTEGHNQTRPSLVADGATGAIIVWEDSRNTNDLDVYASRVDSGGGLHSGWAVSDPNGVLVCSQTGDQARPVLAPDGSGGAIIAWADGRLSSGTNFDIFAAHMQGNGSLDGGAGWPGTGRAVCQADTVQDNPEVVSDGAGGVLVTWMDFRNNRPPSDGAPDIYAQHVKADGGIASGWATDGLPIVTAPHDQAFPRIATDGVGGAIICWDDKRATPTAQDLNPVDIYAQRITAGGERPFGWDADGNALCTAPLQQIRPVITASDVGTVIVAWEDARRAANVPADPSDVYAAGTGYATAAVPVLATRDLALTISPNPAREMAHVSAQLSEAGDVMIAVHDLAGRRIKTLISADGVPAGALQAKWDLRDEGGKRVTAGLYWLRGRVGGHHTERALVVLQ